MDVPDEVADMMRSFMLQEAAYRLRTYRNKAYYSLDRSDGIELDILFVALSPCEIYERKVTTMNFTSPLPISGQAGQTHLCPLFFRHE
jgi:hypothetical protein